MLQERCQLYQMKDGEALREFIFQPFAVLASKRYFPNEADYNMVYDNPLRPNEDVRAVRERLSALQRKRGCFRQINTSDVKETLIKTIAHDDCITEIWYNRV